MIKCDYLTCRYNTQGECDKDCVSLENMYCQDYEEDYTRCIYCGAIMEPFYEEHPYGMTTAKEKVYICPFCG